MTNYLTSRYLNPNFKLFGIWNADDSNTMINKDLVIKNNEDIEKIRISKDTGYFSFSGILTSNTNDIVSRFLLKNTNSNPINNTKYSLYVKNGKLYLQQLNTFTCIVQ